MNDAERECLERARRVIRRNLADGPYQPNHVRWLDAERALSAILAGCLVPAGHAWEAGRCISCGEAEPR
jgi:hypothetical protein